MGFVGSTPAAPRWAIAGLLTVSACVRTLDEETSTSGRLVRDCEIPVPAGIAALGAPVSLEYEDGSLWIWSALELEGGGLALNASAFVEDAETVRTSAPALRRAPDGSVSSLLAMTPQELEHEETRQDGMHAWLAPTGGFVHEERGFLFYEHREGASLLDARSLGTGLCLLEPGDAVCARVEARGSTVLFAPDAPSLDQGGLVTEEDALVYGCSVVADFTRICVARGAPLDHAADPDAYRFFNAEHGSVEDPRAASVLTSQLGAITVSTYLDGYIATSLDPFDSSFYVQRFRSPTEPFGRRIHAFRIAPTEAAFPSGGREHRALRTSPLEIHVTYGVVREGVSRLRFATFRFHGRGTGETYQPEAAGDDP